MKRGLALLVSVCLWPLASQADGLSSLALFLKTASSARADFTQVVSIPAREGQGVRQKTSSGTLEFVRPNRFRFVYKKPFEQSIVADGQTLWLYDADLNQVTARRQAQVLGSTPVALIATASDLRALQADFTLTAVPDQDGMQWVQAAPKAKEGQLQSIRVGFRVSAGQAELAVLEILDSFGQRSVLSFTKLALNVPLSPEIFVFKPPMGADVIRP